MIYIGQTRRSTEIRCKEHMRYLRLGQPDKSAVAGHIMEKGHCMKFNKAHRLVRIEWYMDRLVKQATEIQLHPKNLRFHA
jgi:hypothetical protein